MSFRFFWLIVVERLTANVQEEDCNEFINTMNVEEFNVSLFKGLETMQE